MRYEYMCEYCWHIFEESHTIDLRDLPVTQPCPSCGEYGVARKFSPPIVKVPEGGVGNAANGYSSTHGDAENFKAKSEGKPLPYNK